MTRVSGVLRGWLRGRGARISGASIALAMLVCGMVFAAVAGPAESLHTRTQALRQTVAGIAATTRTIQATISFSTLGYDVGGTYSVNPDITQGTLSMAKQQIASELTAVPVSLTSGSWTSVASTAAVISSGYGPRVIEKKPPEFVFNYRDTLTANTRLVAGTLNPTPGAPGFPARALGVATTAATAARFGVHPGSRLKVDGNQIIVTAIIAPVNPGSAFWQYDVTTLAPAENDPLHAPQWVGEVFADPDQLQTMTTMFGSISQVNWVYPVSLAGVNADQVQGVYDRLTKVSGMNPALYAEIAAASDDISLGTTLTGPLEAFLQTQSAVLAVLLLLFVSLGAVGVAVIFLAARMIVDRREDELIMLRARGSSTRQVALRLVWSAALATIPAAIVGAAIALAVVPDISAAGRLGWILAGLTLVIAIIVPAAVAGWRHRRPAPAVNPAMILTADTRTARISPRVLRRIVAELTLAGAAIAGLVILHGQGTTGGTNWFLTLAPVLVAILAVLITLRLYPLIVRAALRIARHRAGATSYVALAASARTSLATAGPIFALVLALTLTAFAGMIATSISSAQNAESWQLTGADAVVTGNSGAVITPATERAVAAVRGVQHSAAVWTTTWTAPDNQTITALLVDPSQYATLTAATPFPAFSAGGLSASSRSIGVLASPAAAAALGHGSSQLTSFNDMDPIQVHVAGTLTATPASPGGSGSWILMPLQTLPGEAGSPAPGTLLLTGTGIDRTQLSAVLGAGFGIAYRGDILSSLTRSPLQHGAVTLMLLTALGAAGFALLNLILGLALGAADRDLTLTRLTVMGVPHSPRLALTETIPAILAAIIASTACALALPALTGNALDLSVFTTSELTNNTALAVSLQPDLVSVGLPAAILLILAAATLAIQTRTTRHRGPASLLRGA